MRSPTSPPSASVADAWGREREVWEVNALGTLNVVLGRRRARTRGAAARRVLGRGLRAHRRRRRPASTRAGRLAPISPYGRSKAAAEIACARDDLDVVVVRPFPHTGPGQSETFAIPSFAGADRAHRGRAWRRRRSRSGNLAARRDYSDVRCVVDAYIRLLERARRTARLQRRHGNGAQHGLRARPAARARHAWRSRSRSIRPATAARGHSAARRVPAPAHRGDRLEANPIARRNTCGRAERRARRSRHRVSDNHGRRALITGITGQDGSYLAELLLEKGYEVSGVVRRSSTESFERIAHLEGRIELLQADLLDQVSLQEAVRTQSAARGLQPRGAELRADVLVAARADRRVHRRRRDAHARGRPQRRPLDPLLPGVVVGDVRQGAGGAAERGRRRSTRAARTASRRPTATSSR